MKMKKMVVIMTLVISAASFASMNGQGSTNTGKQKMMQQEISILTQEQQQEFQEMNLEAMKKSQSYKLQIEETDIKIKKELLKDEPNIKKLDKFSEEKASLKTKLEKYMIGHKIEMKEKFGSDVSQGLRKKDGNRLQDKNNQQDKKNQKDMKNTNQRKENNQRQMREINQEDQQNKIMVRKINLEIRLEMMAEKPDMEKIKTLIENKAEIQTKMEKSKIRRIVERNEKIIEFINGDDNEPSDKLEI
jgi:hypothetical protein